MNSRRNRRLYNSVFSVDCTGFRIVYSFCDVDTGLKNFHFVLEHCPLKVQIYIVRKIKSYFKICLLNLYTKHS